MEVWLSPHERKDSGIRTRTATSIPLRSISVVAVATSSESFSQRARELRFRCAPSQSWLSPHQKESFQPLSNKFEQLKAFFFSLARSLHEKFA